MGRGVPGRRPQGKLTAYDSPIYIADAALYLSKTKPELGIKNPYSLTEDQLNAAVDLLKEQHANIGEYWSDYTKEVQAFESGTSVIGTSWQVIANMLTSDNKVKIATVLPKEGSTGWSDTWMVSSKAKNPTCMYKWMDWITSPEINAQVAEYFGEAPAQTKACEFTSDKNFCATYHATDEGYAEKISYWTTRRSSAWTAAVTTARPTTSGSTSGSRSRADPGGGPAGPTGLPARPAAGVADRRVPGFTCGTAPFSLLEHRHLHRRGGAQLHQ